MFYFENMTCYRRLCVIEICSVLFTEYVVTKETSRASFWQTVYSQLRFYFYNLISHLPSLYSSIVYILSLTIHFSVDIGSKPDSTQGKFPLSKMAFSKVNIQNVHPPKSFPGHVL